MAFAYRVALACALSLMLTACISSAVKNGERRDDRHPHPTVPWPPHDDRTALPGSGNRAVPGSPGP